MALEYELLVKKLPVTIIHILPSIVHILCSTVTNTSNAFNLRFLSERPALNLVGIF